MNRELNALVLQPLCARTTFWSQIQPIAILKKKKKKHVCVIPYVHKYFAAWIDRLHWSTNATDSSFALWSRLENSDWILHYQIISTAVEILENLLSENSKLHYMRYVIIRSYRYLYWEKKISQHFWYVTQSSRSQKRQLCSPYLNQSHLWNWTYWKPTNTGAVSNNFKN